MRHCGLITGFASPVAMPGASIKETYLGTERHDVKPSLVKEMEGVESEGEENWPGMIFLYLLK